jgi:replication factor C subunit 3/5
MTRTAQFALRRVIEKYTKSTRFCLLCNYIGKIIPALQSRCTRFRFGPLEQEQVQNRLDFVIKQEGVRISQDGLHAIMKLANGDMRRSLNVMQACHMAYGEITEANVYACTGNPLPSDMKVMLNILNNEPMKKAFESQ